LRDERAFRRWKKRPRGFQGELQVGTRAVRSSRLDARLDESPRAPHSRFSEIHTMGATRKNPQMPQVETDEETRRTTAVRPDEMPPEVLEFITAIDDYKRIYRRPFPTWSEVLEILKTLGYSRIP
jgi:hypothetical protein